ncbi:MAG: tetratricopeptide repeat protein, partial [Nitrosospira sp.]
MDETQVENSQNVIAGSTVSANGDVLVGGQKVTNYFYSAQYQDLINQRGKLDARFSKNRQTREKYPNDEDFKTEQLQIGEERDELQKNLDDLKHEVIRLAETFTKIPLNTERLRLARQHFETGGYASARAILDAEEMGNELDALLRQKEQLQHQQAENEANLIDKANEFLILARLTAVDFTLTGRYEKTLEYFEQSLKAAHTVDNTFAYAYFLQEHNQFIAAFPFYTEALEIYRRLAEANPQTYLADVAGTLNNLANLQKARNEFAAAEAGYQEALAIRRRLAEANPQTYLPHVAMTLNNLANLQGDRNDFAAAEAGYQEALAIRRRL